MTDIFNSFTEYQKQTNLSVTELEEELVAYVDPEVFILNEDIVRIRKELDKLQAKCNHIWKGNFCVVCHAKQED